MVFVARLLTVTLVCGSTCLAAMADSGSVLRRNSTVLYQPLNARESSSTTSPPIVYILDVFTYYSEQASLDAAIQVFERQFPHLLQRFEFEIIRKNSNRDVNSGRGEQLDPQLALWTTIRSLNYDNRTYAYISGPNGGGEGKTIALMTPIYNMVTVSGGTTADVLSDVKAYPLHTSFCARNIDYGVALKVFVQMLNFDRIGFVLVDEFSVERMHFVENLLLNQRTQFVTWHVLSRERIHDVVQSLRSTEPYGIITEFSGTRGAQAICKLYKEGIVPQDVVWIVGGPFERANWWEPLPGQPGWNCTRDEMLSAINGTLAVDAYIEPPDQNAAEVGLRVDKLNNGQVKKLMIAARARYPAVAREEISVRSYYSYDAALAGLLAFYRAADKFEQQFNMSVAALDSYVSSYYEAWSRLLMEELLNTSFYGATGHVSLSRDRHSGEGTIQVSQFQSRADTGEHSWALVGKANIAFNTSQVWSERLIFATATGEPPHVIKIREAANYHRTITVVVVCGVVALVFAAGLVAWCLVKRAREAAWRDVSWVVDKNRLTYNEFDGRRRSTTSSISVSIQSSLVTLTSRVDPERSATLDGKHQIWMRQICSSAQCVSLKSTAPVKLNRELFPQARAMLSIMHENVNRFYGFSNTGGDEKDAVLDAIFALQPKGTVRRLMTDSSFTIELEMKLLFLTDIVRGIMVLHDAVGPHGSLHPENLLLDERYTVKITDYGLAKFRLSTPLSSMLINKEFEQGQVAIEKLVFRAPELLRSGYSTNNEKILVQNFTTNCDVYSVGMTFAEIMTRQVPFSYMFEAEEDAEESSQVTAGLLNNIAYGTEPLTRPLLDQTLVNAPIADLITLCWQENATQRPAAATVLRLLQRVPGYRVGNVMQNLVKRLENFAQNLQKVVEERTQALVEEMGRSEQLLLQILPRSVAEDLKKGKQVLPETFDSVSIYFSDIVGFTTISSESSPMEVVNLLNNLYTTFDSIISRFDVYKVETIGDAYMVASGVPERNGHFHCAELARMSLRLQVAMRTFSIPHRPTERLALRIGLHCGPCVAGVVGLKMPRYCLFGDTVNTASRMESNGQAHKIHTSEQFYELTFQTVSGLVKFESRGQIEIKGKGLMTTYWLKDNSESDD